MADSHTIATVNINGCCLKEKQHLERIYICKWFRCAAAARSQINCLDNIPRYNIHYDIGMTKGGMAITV
jgi:hypothetical protein